MIEFSVIIPTYKRPDLLRQCLEALAPARQTLAADRYEVIVCDDDDSNETRELVRGPLAGAVYTLGPGRGPAANRNHGSAQAKGRWLVFTDDDCVPSPGWLAAFAAALQPDYLVYEGRTTCIIGLRSPMEYAPVNETGGFLWSCNFMIENPLFRSLGGFAEGFPHAAMEDVDLRERLKDQGLSWIYVPEAVVDHPPKELQLTTLLAGHESYYYFSIVRRGTTPRLRQILLMITKTRFRALFRTGWHTDLPKTASLVVAELSSVCFCHLSWRARFLSAAARHVKDSRIRHANKLL